MKTLMAFFDSARARKDNNNHSPIESLIDHMFVRGTENRRVKGKIQLKNATAGAGHRYIWISW